MKLLNTRDQKTVGAGLCAYASDRSSDALPAAVALAEDFADRGSLAAIPGTFGDVRATGSIGF